MVNEKQYLGLLTRNTKFNNLPTKEILSGQGHAIQGILKTNRKKTIHNESIKFKNAIKNAVRMAIEYGKQNHINDIINHEQNLNQLEKLASLFQLAIVNKDVSINECNINEKTNIEKNNYNYQSIILLWRNVSSKRECMVCHVKTKKLRKCPRCKTMFFCSRKCQKKDWKKNEDHRKRCTK